MVLNAQYSDQIQSDRPGQSIGSNTLGAKVIQIQTGLAVLQSNYKEIDADAVAQTNNTVLRLGITERFEVMGMLNYEIKRTQEQGFSNDVLEENGMVYNYHIGGRFNVLNREGLIPSIGIQGQIAKSTYDSGENFNDEFYLTLTASNTLTGSSRKNQIGLFSNIIYQKSFGLPFYSFNYTLGLSVNTGPNFGFFIEGFGVITSNLVGGNYNIDAGIGWFPTDNLKLDRSVGLLDLDELDGIVSTFVDAGISYRLNWR
ncbi:MAG: hypothetical protein AAF193_04700 [Bacteroidota bacterium]